MPMDTRFSSLAELARLPWFAVREGRLVLSDASVPPAIDMHAHLALSYGPLGRVDLRAREASRLYLPVERPFDLEPYANRNFATADLRRMQVDLGLGSFTPFGLRRTHTVPNLLRDMRDAGVDSSVLLPIDFPLLSNNAERWLRAADGAPELICFGSVHPFARDPARALDRQVALGVRGLKVHPAVQLVGPDHPKALALFRLCAARGLPVLLHCGPVDIETRAGRRLTQVVRYKRALAECPETTFVLGHSGALQMEQALALARKYPNAWLELSCQGLANVRRILDEADPERILFGSDWPFYHPAIPLAKVLLATEGREGLREPILRGNALRLLGAGAKARAA